MAIDTLAKRNSALSVSTCILPIPDGTVAQADRQTLLRVYGGILAAAAAVVISFVSRDIFRDISLDISRNINKIIGEK